jgi:hypothetical protein
MGWRRAPVPNRRSPPPAHRVSSERTSATDTDHERSQRHPRTIRDDRSDTAGTRNFRALSRPDLTPFEIAAFSESVVRRRHPRVSAMQHRAAADERFQYLFPKDRAIASTTLRASLRLNRTSALPRTRSPTRRSADDRLGDGVVARPAVAGKNALPRLRSCARRRPRRCLWCIGAVPWVRGFSGLALPLARSRSKSCGRRLGP